MLIQHATRLIVIALTLPLLAACADGDKKAASQIIARVNDDEISVYQLNDALAHAGLTEESQVKQAMSLLLKDLIDQSLAVQQAKTDKLDRDPAVLIALESAKRQILAEVWLQRQIKNEKKISTQDIAEFNHAHPELFEKRKIYQLKELLIENNAENQQPIDQLLEANADVNALAEKLEAKKISFKGNQATVAAEQLPMEYLSALYALPNGHYIKVMTEKGLLIIGVLSTTDSPLDSVKAGEYIETFLLNEQRKKRTEAAVKKLRDAAKIEYLGEFSDDSLTVPKEALPVTKAEPLAHEDAIRKGITGLK